VPIPNDARSEITFGNDAPPIKVYRSRNPDHERAGFILQNRTYAICNFEAFLGNKIRILSISLKRALGRTFPTWAFTKGGGMAQDKEAFINERRDRIAPAPAIFLLA
jgi:hypothetical protein